MEDRREFRNGTRKQKIENVWQTKDFKSFVFVSVAGKGLTGANLGCVAMIGLTGFLELGRGVLGLQEAYRLRRSEH